MADLLLWFVAVACFIVGWFLGRAYERHSQFHITDFRQRRRIALRRASREYFK